MLAERRPLTADERRHLDRHHAIGEVMTMTTAGLSARSEQDVTSGALRLIEPILELADSATVALLELEAIDRRLNYHVLDHDGCTYEAPCPAYRVLQIRRARLQRQADRAMRALWRGHR